ncbi:hypothetical protein J8F10_02715 [Gemmata sp. G18]|uniref:Lipoprotein n=1 Tax=Gemmata palustris TaxID=2822762 RepID=A0ABS5BL39_9BACT|nr:hypothetical protein [Gemmata palustris]MBP3954207.1 hypothetical protein [Gemmata palustris]
MKRFILLAALAPLTGCTNAPGAGFLDSCFPSRAKSDAPPPAPGPRPVGDPVGPGPGPKPDKALPPPDFGADPRNN